MVLIYFKISLGMYGEIHHAMLTNLFQHVVEEAQSCRYIALARTIEIYLDIDVCFLGGALHLSDTVTCKENFSYLVPIHSVFAENEALATEIFC